MTDGALDAYAALKRLFERINHLRNASMVLDSDALLLMPNGAAAERTGQLVAMEETVHEILARPETAALLDAAEAGAAQLSRDDARNLALMRREWVHAAALPGDLAGEIKRIESEGHTISREMGASGEWSKVQGWYEHVFATMRAAGQAKQAALGTASPYDALLDCFTMGLRDETAETAFTAVARELPGLIRAAVARQKGEPERLPLPHVPQDRQAELCRRVAAAMNFDFTRGRMDVVNIHPACGGSPDDARYTVICHEEDFLYAVYTVLHENGHADYYQGYPKAWRYQPAGADLGTVMHEAMARIMEQHAGRSPEFLSWLEGQAREVFEMPDDPALSAENLRRHLLHVTPSFVRLEADELTYPAHIILRHRMERALVEGTLNIADLPQAWNDGMEELLGIRPTTLAEGCLQDTHWPCGYVGYFPGYTLGDMVAAQLFAAARRDCPGLVDALGRGDFTPLTGWLTENVYGKGALVTQEALLRAATGEDLNPRHYMEHLSRRYLGQGWTPSPGTGPGGIAPPPAGP